jgi:hypothetical protein
LLRDNTAEAGAGVFVESGPVPFAAGEFNADNSTLDGNLGTGGGGAVWVAGGDDPDSGGAVLLRNSTISHNSAATAGGIRSQTDGSPWVVISYTVLAGNGDGTGSPDCRGTVFSGGRNLLQDPDGCDFFPTSSDLTYVDPLLGPLLDNGGPTETRAPQPDSPAVDTPSFSCLPVDQRGVPRSQGSGCDIGAVELAFDSDGDGVPDLLDGCPLDPDKSEPGVCGCGVPEVGGDADLDGLADCVDPCPDDPDVDGDGFSRFGGCPAGHPADCDDANSATFPGAAERNDGLDNQCPGDPGHGVIDETSGNSGFHDPDDESRYSWPPQAGAESYEVARASSPDFFTECTVFAASADTFVVDITEPPPGVAFFYMNHAVTPHVGSWGQRSNGQERVVPCDIR